MRRGTVCWVNLGSVAPPEMGKARPAVVVSNSEQNAVLPTVVVVPLSSQPPEIHPLRVHLDVPQGRTSFAVLPGLRQVSKARIQESVGFLRGADLDRLNQALALYLSD